MSIRAFISVDIPDGVKKQITKIQDSLPEFLGKKTEKENLHLTLKFLGEIDEEKAGLVKEKLRSIKIKKFESVIDEIGVFSEHFIRIVWIHMGGCDKLQKEIDNALEGLFEKERRFMSHLTIARIKKIRNKKEFLDNLSKIKIKESRFIVDKFYLMKSDLNRNGPVYSVLEEFPLI